nr:hypothetical protein [Tanacetum cinerariifolium]
MFFLMLYQTLSDYILKALCCVFSRLNKTIFLTRPTTKTESLTIPEIKVKLVDMMSANPTSFDSHERHTALYNALVNSIAISQVMAKKEPIQEASLKKRPHDDHDPSDNYEGENKMEKQKLAGESSSGKTPVTTKSTNQPCEQ